MSVVVRIPGPLRKITDGLDKVDVREDSLGNIVEELELQFPGIKERLLEESGELRHFVNVYVNGEDIQFLQGMETHIGSGDEISIVPAVAGG